MSIPMDLLHNEKRNAYEVTQAMIERANQLAQLKENVPNSGIQKPVSDAISEVLDNEVIYRLNVD